MCVGSSGGAAVAFFEMSLTVKRVMTESPLLVPVTLAKTCEMPGLSIVAKCPYLSAIPAPPVVQEVEDQVIRTNACSKNQWRHWTVSVCQRYKWFASVTHYASVPHPVDLPSILVGVCSQQGEKHVLAKPL